MIDSPLTGSLNSRQQVFWKGMVQFSHKLLGLGSNWMNFCGRSCTESQLEDYILDLSWPSFFPWSLQQASNTIFILLSAMILIENFRLISQFRILRSPSEGSSPILGMTIQGEAEMQDRLLLSHPRPCSSKRHSATLENPRVCGFLGMPPTSARGLVCWGGDLLSVQCCL